MSDEYITVRIHKTDIDLLETTLKYTGLLVINRDGTKYIEPLPNFLRAEQPNDNDFYKGLFRNLIRENKRISSEKDQLSKVLEDKDAELKRIRSHALLP